MHYKRIALYAGLIILAFVPEGNAGALGIPLDAFLVQLLTWAIGLTLIMGMFGLLGWAGQHFDFAGSTMFAGLLPFFVRAGIVGGGATILAGLGLVSGAVLP